MKLWSLVIYKQEQLVHTAQFTTEHCALLRSNADLSKAAALLSSPRRLLSTVLIYRDVESNLSDRNTWGSMIKINVSCENGC